MSQDAVFAAKGLALAALDLTYGDVGREQSTFHPDGSVEFVFFSSRGKKRLLAHVKVNPDDSVEVL